ncbi:hypothetical protein [Nocardiopsis deserti]|uniref:hypothetical protein n=1 Tax=Nocardiopsis deserti TaxID=2605988 RepID=UPI00123A65D6|nr:hypothetical protein [Nocardiopsis deserti]
MTERATTPALPARAHLRLALEPPRWALAFYARHLLLVAGLSLVPAAERFGVALWGEGLSTPSHVALEVIAQGARVVLIILVVRVAILKDERVRRGRHLGDGRRVRAFLDHRWPSLLWQSALLLALFAVFSVVPEQVVPLWIPASAQDLYWALLLAGKNVTVIAVTLVWMVGAVRQMLIEGGRLLEESSGPGSEEA